MTTTAVVTGMAALAPTGLGLEAHWDAVVAGRTGIGPLTRFDSDPYWGKLAGEVGDFDAKDHLPGKLLPQTDHMTRMTIVATDWALADAGISTHDVPAEEMSVVTAATAGGYEFGQREMQKLWSEGPAHVSAYQSFAWFYAVNTGQISIRHGMRGPGAVVVADQAGGLDAIGHARRKLRGDASVAVTGAVDSSLCPSAWVAHQATDTMSRSRDVDRAYLPFDTAASGHVVGEGGAILVLEHPDRVGDRPVYGAIAGYAATFGDLGLERAARLAIADAGLTPADVDVVFADAAGSPSADAEEAAAIAAVFGAHGVPVTAPKTMTGRLFAGGAPLDVATALLALRNGVIPPTINVTEVPAEYELDLVVGTARRQPLHTALILARGRGGFASALVVTATV